MEKRMSIFGVGPKMGLVTIFYSVVAVLLNYLYKAVFAIEIVSSQTMTIISIVLLLIGIPFYIASGKTLTKMYKMDVLYTKGVFSLCRHPLYTAVILFIIPGALLFFHSWMILSIPLVMLIACSILVKKEEHYLAERYPEEYSVYKEKVGPFSPKFW